MDKDIILAILKKACIGSTTVLLPCMTAAAGTAEGWTPTPAEAAAIAAPKEITVKGTVTDGNEPIIGASVLVKGSPKGAMTDFDGNFTLTGVSPNAVITVSYVGFETQEIPVDGKTTINVTLKESSTVLDEVVVVGFGTQKKSISPAPWLPLRPKNSSSARCQTSVRPSRA